jgi:hypothetical protein
MLKHLTKTHVSLMIVSAVFGAVTTLAAQAITAGSVPSSMREAHKPSAMSSAAMQPASQNLSAAAADALAAPESWKTFPPLTEY